MAEYLAGLQSGLAVLFPEVGLRISDQINKDGSVDSELRIGPLHPGDWDEILRALGNVQTNRDVGLLQELPDIWICLFLLFGPDDEEDVENLAEYYERYRGMLSMATYYYPMTIGSMHRAPLTATVMLGGREGRRGFIDAHGYDPKFIMVRLSWNPANLNPMEYPKPRRAKASPRNRSMGVKERKP